MAPGLSLEVAEMLGVFLLVLGLSLAPVGVWGSPEDLAPREYDALMLPVGRGKQPAVWNRATARCHFETGREGELRSECVQTRPLWRVSCSWSPVGGGEHWRDWDVWCWESGGGVPGFEWFGCGVRLEEGMIGRNCRGRENGESWGDVSLRYEPNPGY